MVQVVRGGKVAPETARALLAGTTAGCPGCGGQLRGRQRACSGRCRATLSRRTRVEAGARRTRELRATLEQLDYLRIVAVDDAVEAIKQPLAQLIDVRPGVGGKRPSGGREITPPARFGRRPPLLKSTAPVAGRVRGPGRNAAAELVEPDGERHPGKLPIV
jgi:hypothetical protein